VKAGQSLAVVSCRRRLTAAVAALFLVATPDRAAAHDAGITSIVRIFIDQLAPQNYRITTVDTGVPRWTPSNDMLPHDCHIVADEASERSIAAGFSFECARALTFDDTITFPWAIAGVVASARWSDGTGGSAYFQGERTSVTVRLSELRAAAGTRLRLVKRYVVLGTEHILFGIDHLMFVLGLLLLVPTARSLLATVTAFTVAHSITLLAAVTGLLPVDRGPVEAGIALSIVLLAREIVVQQHDNGHLLHRQPWIAAFVFGLLHGLGFAGALGDIGLRHGDIPLALLFFNVGVELGQLAFIGCVVLAYYTIRALIRIESTSYRRVLGYTVGVLSMVWFMQRLPALWTS
jgi:HupE/UreJ protein